MVAATQIMGNASPPQAGADAPVYVNPFVRAASETRQPFADNSVQLGSSSVAVGPLDVPAIGYLRNIVLYVTATGGAGSGVAGREDAPWNVLQDVRLTDTNGTPLIGPFNGYSLYLINKWGGYTHGAYDPASYPSYSAIAAGSGNFTFKVRIPVEITSRDGLGALPNLTSAATYKLSYTIAAVSTVYSTSPATTNPTIRVRAHVEAWSQPMAQDPSGIMNETQPPAVGTTQFWSESSINVNAGLQRLRFTKMGNHLRNMILVYRDDASPAVRSTAEFPLDNFRIEWDNKILDNWTRALWQDQMYERYGQTPDTGVFVLDYTHDADGTPGNENRHLWLKTVSGTRLEFIGEFSGSGGTLTVLTNDIAVRGQTVLSSGGYAN